ncbi:MAG: DUF2254 domain-containing protein, partial [Bryobacterales bacterium]
YTSAATARTTLATTAGAMIAATGTVFSITMVTLSLTSQQFGPRLLRRFMTDRTTKYALGLFIATGFYCLVALRLVRKEDENVDALHISAVLAVLLAALSMAMLIAFINHVIHNIQAPEIVASVAGDLDDAIERLFPEELDEDHKPLTDPPNKPGGGHEVRSTQEGYIQAVSVESLVEYACAHRMLIELCVRPGAFISSSTKIAQVWPSEGDAWELPEGEAIKETINDAIIVGVRRTPRQDVGAPVAELVEVAVRSLSPGINDPFTAMSCIDRLGASLGFLAGRETPSPYHRDEDGRVRLLFASETLPELLDDAFHQIRRFGRGNVSIALRLLDALESVARSTDSEEDHEAIRRHVELVVRGAEDIPEERDRLLVEARADRVLAEI